MNFALCAIVVVTFFPMVSLPVWQLGAGLADFLDLFADSIWLLMGSYWYLPLLCRCPGSNTLSPLNCLLGLIVRATNSKPGPDGNYFYPTEPAVVASSLDTAV
jgi:hypothetical protein